MALHGQTPDKISAAVSALKPFKIGNVSGTRELNGTGRLPEQYAAELRQQDRDGNVVYVLYSYYTPMAWLLRGEDGEEVWVQPNTKYSVSTTGHQNVFARAIRHRSQAVAA